MTTRDEEEKRRKSKERRRHLSVARPDQPVKEANEESPGQWVQLVISRASLAKMARLVQWGLWAQRAVQVVLWLLFGFALAWGLLLTLRAFLR